MRITTVLFSYYITSEIFRKVIVLGRLTNFLKKKTKKQNILYNNQCGFRPKLSTTHAMLDVMNGISTNMTKNQHTGLIFLDLKNVWHRITLHTVTKT